MELPWAAFEFLKCYFVDLKWFILGYMYIVDLKMYMFGRSWDKSDTSFMGPVLDNSYALQKNNTNDVILKTKNTLNSLKEADKDNFKTQHYPLIFLLLVSTLYITKRPRLS